MKTLLVIFAALFIGLCMPSHAKPVAILTHETITITLTDEPCALTAVSQLPNRATWKDDKGEWEGCVGGHQFGVLVLYFTDGTIVLLPPQAFGPAMEM